MFSVIWAAIMTADERGYLTDTLVILIFVYMSGLLTGMVIAAYRQRSATVKEKEENIPVQPQSPTSASREEIYYPLIVPPPTIRVGTTRDCHSYHLDNIDSGRCDSLLNLTKRHPGEVATKRFHACGTCFPQGTYLDQDLPTLPTVQGRTTSVEHSCGARPRNKRERVPIVAY